MPRILDAHFRAVSQSHDDTSAAIAGAAGALGKADTKQGLDLAATAWRAKYPTAHRALAMHALAVSPTAPAQMHRTPQVTPSAVAPVAQGAIDSLFDEGAALVDAGQPVAGLQVLWSLVRLDQCANNYRIMARAASAASDVIEQLDASAPLGQVHLEARREIGLNLSIQRLTVLAQMVMAFGKLHQALHVSDVQSTFIKRNGEEAYQNQVQYAHDMALAAAQEAHMLCRETAQASMAIYAHSGVMRDVQAGVFGADPTQDPRVAAHFAALRWPHVNAFASAVGAQLLTQETDVKQFHDAVYTWQLAGQREIVGLLQSLMPDAVQEVKAFRLLLKG